MKVGFMTGRAEDRERSNWAGDAARPLRWSAWYPKEDAEGLAPDGPAGPAPQPFVAGRAIANAALAVGQDRYPVVLLSHGTGGTAATLAWLAEGLAAAGFVVLGVDHHGNTASEPYRPEGFLCWWERARDLSVLLDHHAEAAFAGRLDLDRVFAAGFSLGGYTALSLLGAITQVPLFQAWADGTPWADGPREFPDLGGQVEILLRTHAAFRASWERQSISHRDPRIKAALLCAPAPTVRGLTVDSLEAISAPVAIASLGGDREAPLDACGQWLHGHLRNSTVTLLDPDAGHYALLCECTAWGRETMPDLCVDAAGVDRRTIHAQVIALATAQFSR